VRGVFASRPRPACHCTEPARRRLSSLHKVSLRSRTAAGSDLDDHVTSQPLDNQGPALPRTCDQASSG